MICFVRYNHWIMVSLLALLGLFGGRISVHSASVSMHFPMWSFNDTLTYGKGNQKHIRDIHMPPENYKNFTQSQNEEDIEAFDQYFFGLHRGLVLETGGGEYSATTFFEKAMQWRAIHVEADTKIYRKLKSTRANQINVHAALCSYNRIVHFVPSQFNAAGIYEQMSPRYLFALTVTLIFLLV